MIKYGNHPHYAECNIIFTIGCERVATEKKMCYIYRKMVTC